MRKLLSLLAVGLFGLMLSGCFTVEQVVDLTEADGARLSAVLELQGELGEAEMDLFISALHRAVPAIEQTAQYQRVKDGSTITYRWVGKEKQPLEDLPFTLKELPNGVYAFEWAMEPIPDLSDEMDSDSVLMRVVVKLPKTVDFANTLDTQDNVATWLLRKKDLVDGARLRAVTY